MFTFFPSDQMLVNKEHNLTMETAPFVGQWASQRVSFRRRDALLYALGIGIGTGTPEEDRFVYEGANEFSVFPTFPLVLGQRGTTSGGILPFPSPAMTRGSREPPLPGTKFVLDGERHLEVFHPLPLPPLDAVARGPSAARGDHPPDTDDDDLCDPPVHLELRSRLVGVHARGSGAAVERESLLVDPMTDTVLCRIVQAGFCVGATGFKDAGTSFSSKVAVPDREPDAVDEVETRPDQAALYRLSGDYNPLHIDGATARKAGFERPILHGLCTLGIAARSLLERYGASDPARFRAIKLRWASPVLPGQTLIVESWRSTADSGGQSDSSAGGGAGERIVFRCRVKETDKVCVNNAFVDVLPAAGTPASPQPRARL
jgi:acyl dehydratase